jgi:putative transposase
MVTNWRSALEERATEIFGQGEKSREQTEAQVGTLPPNRAAESGKRLLSNQVWPADITYIPMTCRRMYLVAVMDWHSGKMVFWRLSNTLEPGSCVEALNEAIGCPEIFSTDQGVQFSIADFTEALKDNVIVISIGGRARVQDNVFIERLWWTLKHQYVYHHSVANGSELMAGLLAWFRFFNRERVHHALDNRSPDGVYFGLPHPLAKAA